MTWRQNSRFRRTVVATALAVAVCGVVPAGISSADEPVAPQPETTEPAAPPAEEPAPAPETGEVGGADVAVGLPPVPPANDEPQVAVGLPPVPPVDDEPQVAVGLPPVPPAPVAVAEPQVAVGKPPVPPAPAVRSASPERGATPAPRVPTPPTALGDTVSASLDLIDDCL